MAVLVLCVTQGLDGGLREHVDLFVDISKGVCVLEGLDFDGHDGKEDREW